MRVSLGQRLLAGQTPLGLLQLKHRHEEVQDLLVAKHEQRTTDVYFFCSGIHLLDVDCLSL